ncbi:MAG TPA: hypothetical protein VIK86_05820 [Candidatus Paceibacterota bacterium]
MENNIFKIKEEKEKEPSLAIKDVFKEASKRVSEGNNYPTLDEQEGNFGDDEKPDEEDKDDEE